MGGPVLLLALGVAGISTDVGPMAVASQLGSRALYHVYAPQQATPQQPPGSGSARAPSRCPTVCCTILPAPPAPPIAQKGYGGDDGDSLVLRSLSIDNVRAVLSVWMWQTSMMHANAGHSREHLLRQMTEWRGHLKPSTCKGLLRGRPLGAFIGENLEGLVLMRYERDVSTFHNFFLCKHLMVVDWVATAPRAPGFAASMIEAGIIQSVRQLGLFHSMRVVFSELGDDDDLLF